MKRTTNVPRYCNLCRLCTLSEGMFSHRIDLTPGGSSGISIVCSVIFVELSINDDILLQCQTYFTYGIVYDTIILLIYQNKLASTIVWEYL